MAGLGVESGGGLIQQQHLGFADQGPGDGQSALHAPRQRLHVVVGPLGELYELQQFSDAGAQHRPGQVEVPPIDVQVLGHRQLFVEIVLLGDHPEARPDFRALSGRVHAQDAQGPAGGVGNAADHPHGGRLARSVGPQKAEHLAPFDLEVDAVHRSEVAEPLGQPPRRD